MAYQVLARKWRPQQFDDVVGQDHVTQTLKNAVESERLAHAYLFVGPRGIGKTSIARIFAKALNCAEGPAVNSCGKCAACLEIAAGTSLDVLEIDGASNNGVDQVRELRETVKYVPVSGKYKIYIIDEVHMLSTAAFNALLKTLEEPPAHVKFIFATTEPQKILATIVSRCQRFDLRRIPVPLIIGRLELIAKAENVTVDSDALLAIARGAEGGLRDAESALDQLISFKGNKIGEDDVLSVFGLVSREALEELAAGILKGDIRRLIKRMSELDEAGKDLQRLAIELMEYFRNLLVCLHVEDLTDGLDLTGSQVEVLKEQCMLTDAARLIRVSRILAETEDRMRYALSKRTLMETALVRCARAATVVSLDQILVRLNELKKQIDSGSAEAGGGRGAAGSDPPSVGAVAEAGVDYGSSRGSVVVSPSEEAETLRAKWHEIVVKMSKIAPLAGKALSDAHPLRVEEGQVVIGFDSEFADGAERFKSARNRKALAHTVGGILGRKVTVLFEITDGACEAAAGDSVEESIPAEVPDSPREKSEKPGTKSQRNWAKEEAVGKTLDMFGGTIVDVRE